MRSVLWIAALLSLAASPALAQGRVEVDQEEIRRLGDMVQQVGGGHRSDPNVDAYVEAMGPPASDADKWFISLLSMRACPACEKLKRDFAADSWLRALANPSDPKQSWSHFNVYDRDDKSQAFRFEKVKVAGYPTVLVQPPRSGKYGEPKTIVFQATGYAGDPHKLAGDIAAAIRKYVAPVEPRREGHQQLAADRTPPWQPVPKQEPVTPLEIPPVSPLDPVTIPPAPGPAPKPVDPPAMPPTAEPISAYPEAIVITDSEDGLNATNDERIKSILEGLRRERGKNLKVRFMDWRDAKDRFPVHRDEMPVVLLTNDGRIEDKISGRLLPYVQTDRRPVGIADLPVASILTLILSGFSVPAAFQVGLWLVGFIRARRQAAGKPLLLDDEALARLAEAVQGLLTSKSGGQK